MGNCTALTRRKLKVGLLKACLHWTFFGKTYRDNGYFTHFKSSADSPGRFPLGYFSEPVREVLPANFCQGKIPETLLLRRKVQCGQRVSGKPQQESPSCVRSAQVSRACTAHVLFPQLSLHALFVSPRILASNTFTFHA